MTFIHRDFWDQINKIKESLAGFTKDLGSREFADPRGSGYAPSSEKPIPPQPQPAAAKTSSFDDTFSRKYAQTVSGVESPRKITPTEVTPEATFDVAPEREDVVSEGSSSLAARNSGILPELERSGIDVNSLSPVFDIIKRASDETGVPEDLLQDIAFQESRFNPSQKNPEGTATGLFQFVDQTWREMMTRYPSIASSMDDRYDPYISAIVAAKEIEAGRLSRWNASKPVWGPYYESDEITGFYQRK